MRSHLRKQIAEIAAMLGPPAILGIWAHDDGRPTYHQLASYDVNIESWFKTGELPKNIQFVAVMHETESERLGTPDPETLPEWAFKPTEEELQAGWKPFPENLHPNALKQLHKMLQTDFYSFFDGQLQGMNGPLRPDEQRRELYPHG